MGKGVDFMENHHHWHGVAPNKEQTVLALGQLQETFGRLLGFLSFELWALSLLTHLAQSFCS